MGADLNAARDHDLAALFGPAAMFNHMASHTLRSSRDLNPVIGRTIARFQMKQDFAKKILGYLARQDWPVTTEMVAKALGVSWNTAQLHLYKLMAEGLVKGRRVGRQNQWIADEKSKHDDTQARKSTHSEHNY